MEGLIQWLSGNSTLLIAGVVALLVAVFGLKLRASRSSKSAQEVADAKAEAKRIVERINKAAASGDAAALRDELLRPPKP